MPEDISGKIKPWEITSQFGGKQPESRKEMPDIRMQKTPDQDPILEAMLAERGRGVIEGYEQGRSVESLYAKAKNLKAIIDIAREAQLNNETFITNGELVSRWDIGRQTSNLRDREIAMKKSLDRLIKLEIVEKLDDKTAKQIAEKLNKNNKKSGKEIAAIDVKKKYGIPINGGFGLNTFSYSFPSLESFRLDKDGKQTDERYRIVTQEATYYGDEDERKGFGEGCAKVRHEIEARNLMQEMWGFYHKNREALALLVELYFQDVPSVEAIQILFNAEFNSGEVQMSVAGTEFRNFGDKVEMAMRLYYINALCEKPALFNKLIDTPGWKIVFPDSDKGNEAMEKYVGKPEKWEPEGYKDLGAIDGMKDTPLGSVRSKKMLKEENGHRETGKIDEFGNERWEYNESKDLRNDLTRNNIFAKSSPMDSRVHEGIQKFLGGGEGANKESKLAAKTAQALAYKFFKLWMMADNYGYEVYKDKDAPEELGVFKGKILQFENGSASSDLSKTCYPSGYNLKNRRRKYKDAPYSRDHGPQGSFGKIPRLTTDFLRMMSTTLESGEELSFHEQWWGYKADSKDPRVEAKRIGELPWTELEVESLSKEDAEILGVPIEGISDEAWNVLYLSTFMAGWDKSPGRTYPSTLKTTFGGNLRELEGEFFLKLHKAADVGVKKGVAVNGIFRGNDAEKMRNEHIKQIINAFWEGVASTEEYLDAFNTMVFESSGISRDKKIKLTEKIRRIAAKLGIELKHAEPTYKTPKL